MRKQAVVVIDGDTLLRPFLDAADEVTAETLLAQVISEHGAPVIKSVIKSKLRVFAVRL